jgi:trk system potassium uptake protein TrkA
MDRFAIIGLGRFGRRLARMLSEAGAEVIAIDRSEEIIEMIRDEVTVAVALDATDERALVSQGVDKVDVAVVGIGADFEASVLTTVILKQLGVPRVVTRATTTTRGEILRRVGADELVNPERESAYRWAHRLLGPTVIEQIPLAEGYSLVQIPAPAPWQGKSLAELDVRRRYNVNIVAIRRQPDAAEALAAEQPSRPNFSVPLPHDKLDAQDILVVIGTDEDIAGLPG